MEGVRLEGFGQLPGVGRVLGFSGDGRLMLAVRRAGARLELWDVSDTARPVRRAGFRLPIHPGLEAYLTDEIQMRPSVVAMGAVSADGRWAVVGGWSGDGRYDFGPPTLYDISDPARPRRAGVLVDASVKSEVSALAFAPGGRMVLAGTAEGVQVWDVREQRRPVLAAVHRSSSGDEAPLAVSSDGQILVAGGDRTATLWNLEPLAPPRVLADREREGQALAVESGEVSVAGDAVGVADASTVWDISDRADPVVVARMPPRPAPEDYGKVEYTMAVHPGRRLLAQGMAGNSSPVTLWELSASPRQAASIGAAARGAWFGPDGRILAVDDAAAGGLVLWDVSDVERPVRLAVSAQNGPLVAGFAADGRTLAVSGSLRTSLWDVSRPAGPVRLATVQGSGTPVLSRDGRLLVLVAPGWSTVWDLADRTRPREMSTLRGTGAGAAFDPSGRLLFIGGGDPQRNPMENQERNLIVVWNLADAAHPIHVAGIAGHFARIADLELTPDGRTLVSYDGDGRLRLWDVGEMAAVLADPVASACALADPGLSPDEWAATVPDQDYVGICPDRFRWTCEQFGAHRPCWADRVAPRRRRARRTSAATPRPSSSRPYAAVARASTNGTAIRSPGGTSPAP
jgi:WD40 repeat protein